MKEDLFKNLSPDEKELLKNKITETVKMFSEFKNPKIRDMIDLGVGYMISIYETLKDLGSNLSKEELISYISDGIHD